MQVDDEDYEWANMFKWSDCKGHAYGFVQGKDVFLHRYLMKEPPYPEAVVDHIDRDTYNNQKANLRWASFEQNAFNRTEQVNNTSGFKGVSKQGNSWRMEIKAGGQRIRMRGFATAREAALAYDEKAKELHGEFAGLNFPIEVTTERFIPTTFATLLGFPPKATEASAS